MKNTLPTQNWIANLCRATTGAALTFAAVLALAVIPISTPSAQAQTFTTLASLDGTGAVSIAEARNPAVTHNTWSSGTALPTARQGAYVGVIGENIYVIAGITNSAVVGNNEIYNAKTKSWTTGPDKPTPMWGGASAVVNGILYCIGGSEGTGDTQTIVEAYDPATDNWSTEAAMPTSRNSITAVVDNNIIYVIGGFAFGSGRLATVESYDPATNTWTEEAPLSVAKSDAAVGKLGAVLVAADGLSNGGVTGDAESYNVKKNKWAELTADSTPRAAPCFGVSGTNLYVASGGTGSDGPTDVNEAYSSKTKSWTTLAAIPQAAVLPASVVVGGKLYCIGGSDNGLPFAGTVYDYVQIYQP